MAAQADAQPIIIKRKKKGGGDGHHGGAWKVAYADFVTAMMAFFMLMWLLNATTEKQRKGIADYFSPTIPVNRVSGGGDGAFGGDSVFSEMTLPKNGTGATSQNPTEKNKANGTSGPGEDSDGEEAQQEVFETLEAELQGKSGESDVHDELLKHIVTKITDEGLVIEVFALPDAPIFEPDSATPTQLLKDIAVLIASISRTITNPIAVGGHVPAEPIVKEVTAIWEQSSEQADAMRLLMENSLIASKRITRVSGHADREPTETNPMDIRNNRIEVILLRE